MPTKIPSTWKEKLRNAGTFTWEVAKVVIISLAIIIPVRYFLIQPFYVKGTSMEPNFKQYEYLVIDELSYRFHAPARGDVVVLRDPYDQSQFFIKRVIGLPGETVEVQDRHVYINGKKLDESAYLASSVETWGNMHLTLKEDELLVLGDNRSMSLDGRNFGPVTKDTIIGRTWLRAWPFTRLARFTQVQYN
ncbi:MAG TPA: signal peptidase I [Patescibacteria group bacterium]|nr:signal peptidase I [Patescibacteria group bacterium]